MNPHRLQNDGQTTGRKKSAQNSPLYLAANPEAGDVIPGSGGCRKVRWTRYGGGKRGGVRVIYTARLKSGALVLLVIYAKNAKENIPAHILKQIAEEMGHAS